MLGKYWPIKENYSTVTQPLSSKIGLFDKILLQFCDYFFFGNLLHPFELKQRKFVTK
jgi:hypothetical protein